MTGAGLSDRIEAWDHLSRPATPAGAFEPEDVADLPAAARRFLTHAITPGTPLTPTVILEMEGDIRLNRWMPFQARQVLRAGEGFVWRARVGKTPLVFRGGDALCGGRGSLDFRLWGILPVARASGPNIDRSAAGRFAAETVAWAPQTLMPQLGARWTDIDNTHATVAVPIGNSTSDVTITVDGAGRLCELSTQRWGDPGGGPFDINAFGGDFQSHHSFSGVTIASAGRVGWWWGTSRWREGEFFRYRVTTAHVPAASPHPS